MKTVDPKPCLRRSFDQALLPVLPKNGLFRKVASLVFSASLLAAGALQATVSATLTTLHSFDITNDGALPVRGLLQHSNGNFYGSARSGATNSHGTIFQVTPGGIFSVLHTFTGDASTDGATPIDTLVEGPDHALYGVCGDASVPINGNVFKLTTSGTFTPLLSLSESTDVQQSLGGGAVGINFGADGKLYVTTNSGGTTFNGSIIQMGIDGSNPVKFAEFTGTEGTGPNCHMLLASDGNFYGTASSGGSSNHGTVFKLTTDGTLTALASFDGTHASVPTGAVIEGSDGNLYGTTTRGTSGTNGTVFKVTKAGVLTIVAQLNSTIGTNPGGALVQGPDFNYYGLTSAGGTAGLGSIFKMTPTGTVTNVLSFRNNSAPMGSGAIGDLIVGNDGLLWGTTYLGGDNLAGTVFKADVGFNALAPTIGVQVGSGSPLISGTSYISFGYVGNGAAAIQTITVKNNGNALLNISGTSVTTGNYYDFSIDTSAMDTTVNPGGQTTFTVKLAPSTVGTRAATLKIMSDDPIHPTFSITLAATAVPPSAITFTAANYNISQGAKTATLTLSRAVTTQAQTVVINTGDGTDNAFPPFTAALAGVDYTDLSGAATTVSFAVGQADKNVAVTLSPKTGAVGNKRFTATISSPSLSATLGAITSTTVNILATDTTKPDLDVTYPDAGTTTLSATDTQSVTITGTTGDTNGISKLMITVNGVATNVALGTASGTSAPFSLTFGPVLGANTIVVTSYDLRNNATTISRPFTLTGGVPLSIVRTAPGAIASRPDLAGTVAVVATPARSASPMLPTTANAITRTCNVVPGVPVHLTATDNNGYAFHHWSGLPSDAVTVSDQTTFAMPTDPLTITAVYVVAPFAGATGTTGSFYGLIGTTDAATSIYNTGYITGTLTTTNGAFSGVISIDGVSKALYATFYGDGSSTFTLSGVETGSVSFGGRTLTLSYNADGTKDQITVSTTKGGVTSTGVATRGYYSSARKVPSSLLNVSTTGYFTFTVPTKDQTPTKDHTTYPQGDGVGTISITNTGLVTIAGTLADGIGFTTTSAFTDAHSCPFFVQLVTPANSTMLGAFGGTLVFDTTQPDSDVTGTDLLWIRPASQGSALYTAGWPNGISVDAVGSHYSSSSTAQTSLAMGVTNSSGNGQIVFADGKLTSTITTTLFNVSGNAVTYLAGNPSGLALTFSTGGYFSGSFSPNWTPLNPTLKPTYKGIILQKNGANRGGFGYFISNKYQDAHTESGGVTLSGQ